LGIIIGIALWVVFTPKKLTPIVQKQVDQYIICESEIGEVELTFFSTFPKFGIKINHTTLINPLEGAPNDTLLNLKNVIGIVNLRSLIKDNDLIINDFRLNEGQIALFTDSTGISNYDVFLLESDTTAVDEPTEMPFKIIDIQNVELKKVDVKYVDDQLKMNAELHDLSAQINGTIKDDIIKGFIDAKPFDLSFDYQIDDTSILIAELNNLSLNLNAGMEKDISAVLNLNPTDINFRYKSDSLDLVTFLKDFSGNFDIVSPLEFDKETISAQIATKPFEISLDYNGDNYLQNTQIELNTSSDINLSRQFIEMKDTKFSVNDLSLSLSGSVENDTINNSIITDISYKFDSWQIKKIIALIPDIFSSYLEGIDLSGIISSKGKISGKYDEQNIPKVDIFLNIQNGFLTYESLPFPMDKINGNINLFTDFKSPSSYLRINNFSANTPLSTISTKGMITNLFGDIRADLTTVANMNLSEFMPMIPDSLQIDMKGNLLGNFKTLFLMSQIEKMELEKMKISGSLTFTDFAVKYDSLSVASNKTDIEFMLPHYNPSIAETGFLFASLTTGMLEAKKIESFNTTLKNITIDVETSDVRDSTRIPNILCSFKIGSLTATDMDSMSVSMLKPDGKITISPRKRNATQPEIKLIFNSDRIDGDFDGQSMIVDKINLEVDVENNPNRKSLIAQWNPKGAVNIENGRFISPTFIYPVDIPAVKMRFDTEKFTVDHAKLIIDKSDFGLSGQIINISSYFRGDSILRGNLHFMSEMTDIVQLMALTSGIGDNEESKNENQEEKVVSQLADAVVSEESYQGPYMVPQGIDIILHTNINKATYGSTVISDIKGNVQVYDGILVLDELSLTTPAADMIVTAMYRTPRKNHLFMGINLHLLDIEIHELLGMAPDLDSIMPMLRSFAGTAEFHFAFETYMDSLYNLKKSTIRGASSIRGNDLVLMDSETFGSIAKTLRFSRKTENKVDSISAEFTIFRSEIDVYPFLIVMDKYKGVVGGRHNLDMSFDYNISLVESPLFIRLNVDVKGTPEKMRYRLKLRSRYPKFYRPQSPKKVENEQRNLRNFIRESLLRSIAAKVSEEEE